MLIAVSLFVLKRACVIFGKLKMLQCFRGKHYYVTKKVRYLSSIAIQLRKYRNITFSPYHPALGRCDNCCFRLINMRLNEKETIFY